MNQSLDLEEWPPIKFEGELLPQSLKGISILIDRDFTERTGDWIWRLPHCKELWKEGDSEWCCASATEIIDYLREHRADVAVDIEERLGPHGFDGTTTVDEWISALGRIQVLAESSDALCRWIAGQPSKGAADVLRNLVATLDAQSARVDTTRAQQDEDPKPDNAPS